LCCGKACSRRGGDLFEAVVVGFVDPCPVGEAGQADPGVPVLVVVVGRRLAVMRLLTEGFAGTQPELLAASRRGPADAR
jgi:hypothetical protein